MGWRGTGLFNDRYSLEYNIGEGYYIFEYENAENNTAIDIEFLSTNDLDEAKAVYDKVVEFNKPLKELTFIGTKANVVLK